MNLADHAGGAGPDLDPSIRVDLDPARNSEFGRQLVVAACAVVSLAA